MRIVSGKEQHEQRSEMQHHTQPGIPARQRQPVGAPADQAPQHADGQRHAGRRDQEHQSRATAQPPRARNELHEQPERPLPHTGNDISPEHPHRAGQLSDTG